MPNLDLTLEQLIAKQQENKAERIAKNLENIAKITERVAVAEGAEKVRLQGLLEIHNAHKIEVEGIDPVTIATARFNKLQELKSKQPKL
jgi:hypothetical protein